MRCSIGGPTTHWPFGGACRLHPSDCAWTLTKWSCGSTRIRPRPAGQTRSPGARHHGPPEAREDSSSTGPAVDDHLYRRRAIVGQHGDDVRMVPTSGGSRRHAAPREKLVGLEAIGEGVLCLGKRVADGHGRQPTVPYLPRVAASPRVAVQHTGLWRHVCTSPSPFHASAYSAATAGARSRPATSTAAEAAAARQVHRPVEPDMPPGDVTVAPSSSRRARQPAPPTDRDARAAEQVSPNGRGPDVPAGAGEVIRRRTRWSIPSPASPEPDVAVAAALTRIPSHPLGEHPGEPATSSTPPGRARGGIRRRRRDAGGREKVVCQSES